MVTMSNENFMSKVIRIQDDEKELLSRLHKIYANDYKRYGEYILREPNVPIAIRRIYKVLNERKAYRRISDYFHRKRASKRTRYIDSNDLQSSHCRPMDHDGMQVDGELDDDLHANTDDSDLPLSVSPTMPLISNERVEKNHLTDESSKRPSPSSNSQSQPTVAACISLSSLSATPDLLSIRANIQNALRELGRSHVSNSDSPPSNELCRSLAVRNQLLLDGHRHSKLDDIVRSLSSVVSQQEVSSNRLFDARGQADRWQPTREPVGQLLDRLNTLVDRGHSIYDRVERILDQL